MVLPVMVGRGRPTQGLQRQCFEALEETADKALELECCLYERADHHKYESLDGPASEDDRSRTDVGVFVSIIRCGH